MVMIGGTITNLTAIAAFLRPWEAVIAASTGHIYVHETGSVEATGHKVYAVPAPGGKLTPALIRQAVLLHRDGNEEHMGHSEYDADTLRQEYLRDKLAGKPISLPKNYFPFDDPNQEPVVSWRAHANLLFSNWLNYFVYQTTPYDIQRIPSTEQPEEEI